MQISCNDNIAWRFVGNTVNEFGYHPYRFVYDTAFATIASAALDMTPVPDMVEGVASSTGLSGERSAQLGAGLTFAVLRGLEGATMSTLKCSGGGATY